MCDIGGVCDGCGGDFSHLTKVGRSDFCGRCYKAEMNKEKVVELVEHKKEWVTDWVVCLDCCIPHLSVHHYKSAFHDTPIECPECGEMACVAITESLYDGDANGGVLWRDSVGMLANNTDGILTVNILRSWDENEKVRFAEHLLGSNYPLRLACLRILEEPHGCPACHSGTLISKDGAHWGNCGFVMVREALKDSEPVKGG